LYVAVFYINFTSYVTCPYSFYAYLDHRDLHSFPTRRSSDLSAALFLLAAVYIAVRDIALVKGFWPDLFLLKFNVIIAWHALALRSEEHTSELQSRENLVCRLLLEKKKKICILQYMTKY